MYKTTAIELAAYLVADGFPIKEMTRSETNQCTFFFVENDELNNAIEQYRVGDARIEPRTFAIALRSVKERIYGSSRIATATPAIKSTARDHFNDPLESIRS